MVGIEKEGSVLNKPFSTFATTQLHLYSGPTVKIRIGSASHEYTLPKALLCAQVPYFAAMFQEKRFKEGNKLSTTLEEIEGVVSTRSFEMLVQWVCHNRVVFGDLPPADAIAASIEFARLADMCNIPDLESLVAEHIKQIILANKPAEVGFYETQPDHYTHHLTLEHINAGVLLPEGHPVRKMLASAVVKGYLLRDLGSFFKELQGLPDFAVDLLGELKTVLDSLESANHGMTFEDPISGSRINLATGRK